MPRTPESVQADIDALRKVMASGERRVRFADREVEYRTYAEMEKALAGLIGEQKELAGKPKTRRKLAYRRASGW